MNKAVQMESDCEKACAAVCDIQADESVKSPEAALPLCMLSQEETPTYLPGLDQAQVLRYAALAAKWHEPARDALDTLVLVSRGCSAIIVLMRGHQVGVRQLLCFRGNDKTEMPRSVHQTVEIGWMHQHQMCVSERPSLSGLHRYKQLDLIPSSYHPEINDRPWQVSSGTSFAACAGLASSRHER